MLAWTQTASALAATRAALATASGALHVSPPAQNASISDWAHQLLQKVTIVMVPVEARCPLLERPITSRQLTLRSSPCRCPPLAARWRGATRASARPWLAWI